MCRYYHQFSILDENVYFALKRNEKKNSRRSYSSFSISISRSICPRDSECKRRSKKMFVRRQLLEIKYWPGARWWSAVSSWMELKQKLLHPVSWYNDASRVVFALGIVANVSSGINSLKLDQRFVYLLLELNYIRIKVILYFILDLEKENIFLNRLLEIF